MKNNRREFIKKSFISGLLGFFAPTLIGKELLNNPSEFKREYPCVFVEEYIFDDCKKISDGSFWFINKKNHLVVNLKNPSEIYLYEDEWVAKKIKVKNFKHEILFTHDRSCNIFGELKPISDVKIEPLKIKISFEYA